MTSVESLSPAGKISDSVIYFYIKKIWLFYEKLLKYLNLLATLRKLKKKNFALYRMALLLGPPSSGKTTLLLALAGKLDHELKVPTLPLSLCFRLYLKMESKY